MRKLKIILNCKYFYVFLVFFLILHLYFSIFILKKESVYDENDTSFECIIDNYFIEGDKLKFDLICSEKLVGYYYFNSLEEKNNFIANYRIGDIILIYGFLEEFSSNTIFNLFDYKDFQYNNGVFYKVNIDEFYMVGYSRSIIYKIKNYIISKINYLKSFPYVNALVLGDTDYIKENVYSSYNINGILHLFSISGMHISLFLCIINKIFRNDNLYKCVLVFVGLLLYYFLIESVSLLRAIIFYYIRLFNKKFNFGISKNKCLLLVFIILLVVNPFNVYSSSFWYSTIISSALIIFSSKISKGNYIVKLFKVSIFAFLFSFPITIYNNFYINVFSIVCNLIFVPFVSFILYPLCMITLLCPFFDGILFFIINLFEDISLFLCEFSIFLIFKKPNLAMVIIYYLLILLIFYRKHFLILMLIVLYVHFNYNDFFNSNYFTFIDVGQGDSTFIHINKYNILIDTGGVFSSFSEEWRKKDEYLFTLNSTIPYLRSNGVRKIDYLIITHGDYDHMGEAINFVENFKVEKVIFNCGEFNELEQELIQVLDKKNILYYSCIKELNIDDNKLYFLNNKNYGSENDNSSVIYTKINNYKFLFMGDAGIEVEQDLIKKYNLKDIDIFKVGHHGSRTSSGNNFIEEIEPKYSIISVGKNNRYGHPNKEVLENLKDSKIYRTDQDGSIMFKIKNNKLKIENC